MTIKQQIEEVQKSLHVLDESYNYANFLQDEQNLDNGHPLVHQIYTFIEPFIANVNQAYYLPKLTAQAYQEGQELLQSLVTEARRYKDNEEYDRINDCIDEHEDAILEYKTNIYEPVIAILQEIEGDEQLSQRIQTRNEHDQIEGIEQWDIISDLDQHKEELDTFREAYEDFHLIAQRLF